MAICCVVTAPLCYSQIWTGATIIDAGGNDGAENPAVAMDESGNAVAVFVQSDRLYTNLWNGSSWTGATIIDAGVVNNGTSPALAMDGSGDAVVVFNYGRIYANRWNGSSWTGATVIDAGADHNAYYPAVAMDASGNAIAVFQQSDGTMNRIYANRWNGSSWTGATIIDAGNDSGIPSVAMDGSGNAVAVFPGFDGSKIRIYANRWNGSSWTGATRIDAGGSYHALDSDVAMDASGKAVAVFKQSDGTNYRPYANRWDGSSWTGATVIDVVGGYNAMYPTVAMDGSGNAVVAFQQTDGTDTWICANRWNGSSWCCLAIIDAGTGEYASPPAVAMDASGSAIGVFYQSDGTQRRVYANRWNGSSWGGATLIDLPVPFSVFDPVVAMDGSGNAIAVFIESIDKYHLYANRYAVNIAPTATPTWDPSVPTPTPTPTPTPDPSEGILHYTNITHTVNGLTANALLPWNSSEDSYIGASAGGRQYAGWYSNVYIRRANGTEIQIGWDIAGIGMAYYSPPLPGQVPHYSGYIQRSWDNQPTITLNPGDAIRIDEHVYVSGGGSVSATFISPPLWGGQLSDASWVFNKYVDFDFVDGYYPNPDMTYAGLQYGSVSYVGNLLRGPSTRSLPVSFSFQPESSAAPSNHVPAGTEFFTQFMGFGWK